MKAKSHFSFLNGFNGTVFAYGQSLDKCSISISYLEIYNEVGYDLLDTKHKVYAADKLPKVALLEDHNGELHLRNLSVHSVSSEQEAMRLLFLGDTNRTISETPSNDFSSRSHCIFTIYLSFWMGDSGKVRKSKLSLVDLAGSERVSKTNVSGVTLTEAKSINLSLHYLEQVILALSDSKRSHVPYRNSMMTYMLKDSLGGNCFTVMLATMTARKKNIEETISTCKFSQRVALINTDAVINVESDPQQQIQYLVEEVERLKAQLQAKVSKCNDKLTEIEINRCEELVKEFIENPRASELPIEPDMRLINQCFRILRSEILEKTKNVEIVQKEDKQKCMEHLNKKKEDISLLDSLLKSTLTQKKEDINGKSKSAKDNLRNRVASPIVEPKVSKDLVHVQKLQADLNRKYEIAKNIVSIIEQCQKNIILLQKKLASNSSPPLAVPELLNDLISQQNIYRESIVQLQNLKSEVLHLEHGLQKAEFKIGSKLKQWVYSSGIQENLEIREIRSSEPDASLSKNIPANKYQFNSNLEKKFSKEDYEDRSQVCLIYKNSLALEDNSSFRSTFSSKPLTCPGTVQDKQLPYSIKTEHKSQTIYTDPTRNTNDYRLIKSPKLNSISLNCVPPPNSPRKSELNSNVGNLDSIKSTCPTQKNKTNVDPFLKEPIQITLPLRDSQICRLAENCTNSKGVSEEEVFLQRYELEESEHGLDIPPESVQVPTEKHPAMQNELCEKQTQASESSAEEYTSCGSQDVLDLPENKRSLFKETDNQQFIDFMKTIPLTGDQEVDDEIVNFYRTKFCSS